ncbi:MAG: HigA family addiction module antitoxin [Nitrospinota bacterium]|nr:HigA family addiction module antitoxin [Nitrospinota bacterium]
MGKTPRSNFRPDYLVTPGEVLEDYLESLSMTQSELALRTGLAKKTINEIVKCKSPITLETALKLERTLGRPAHFWNNLEIQYQEDKVRLEEKEKMQTNLDWLKKVPVKKLIDFRWIPKIGNKIEQLEAVLRFFGVDSPQQWKTIWKEYQVEYRQTQQFEKNAVAVSAWLRQGELEAKKIYCEPFDKKKFQQILVDIRNLAREQEPKIFIPKLEALCASAGVAVVFVPELPNTGVCGATRWIGDKAIIQLSLRYKTNDHLWFTFFHEAGHLIKHGKKDIFIEGKNRDGEKESQADVFAQNILIPQKAFSRFRSSSSYTLGDIRRFANEIDIAPGIVVGRLQHEGVIDYNIGNNLKVRYRWNTNRFT